MLIYRLGRRFRGRPSIADGAALAITVEPPLRHAPDPIRPLPDSCLDDGSHTPPHGDALLVHGGGELL
jgi:hypothetical protein